MSVAFLSSVLSFLLPMVFSGIFIFFNCFTSHCFICRAFGSVAAGLLYPLVLAVGSLYLTGSQLFCGQNVQAVDSKFMNFYKLFEHLLEAFPQLVISIVYIANNGGFVANFVQAVSAMFSTGSLILGLVTGCNAAFVVCSFRYGSLS